MKVAHYLNQFFAGLGGEEAAGLPPLRLEGAVGPGRGLEIDVAVTLVCGDDFFGEHEEDALEQLLGWLSEDRPDVLVCGPAFGSGRYGYACGTIAREAARRGTPAVCGMHPDNPGVMTAEGAAYTIPTGERVTGMRDALPRMAALARRLAAGEEIGVPEVEGYLPRGLRRNQLVEQTAAVRAVDLLLAKLCGEVRTEASADFDRVPPPDPVAELSQATLALVTESGLVPAGNPDRLESNRAHSWFAYSLAGVDRLGSGAYETVHGGFDVAGANADPNRLVPLDVVRELEREGRIGHLYETLCTTSGNSTPVATSVNFGHEIAQRLRDAGVQAAILTGT